MNRKTILFIFVVMLFISSCTSSNNNSAKLQKDLYKGTEGILLNLFQDKLPDEVYEGETLSYVVKLTNKGPYPAGSSKLIFALDKGYMQFDNNDNVKEIYNVNLAGKTIFDNLDDFKIVEETIKVNTLDPLSEYHESIISTLFCYDYKGIAIADICIDTDPYSLSARKKACSVKDTVGLGEGQGGPVVISSVDTKMLIDNDFIRPQFRIHITNQGAGTVIKPGTLNQVCNMNPLARDMYNSIILKNIKFSRFGIANFECLPPELVLRQEEDSITCTLKSGLIRKTDSSYTTPLEIEIEYGYMESTTKQIKIKKIPKY